MFRKYITYRSDPYGRVTQVTYDTVSRGSYNECIVLVVTVRAGNSAHWHMTDFTYVTGEFRLRNLALRVQHASFTRA